ncbi:type III secretion protein HrpT [Kosakonia cowanii]|uniref:HrpT family type III secretion system protein n=1 Tax=Kosakonia TaxID=1330547 RepID=UPI00190E06D1|nr:MULTISPECIES: HrpT family type III secretion system protein [Kosakonia]MBK0018068.1 type III secretion protein HrpT [Kosakonia sp. S42]UGS48101.1 type III secretion protein HrpT [Kosakonia cowanii]
MLLRMMLLAAAALMLSACARPQAGCNDVSCRPSSDLHKLTIWWQPQLRNGLNDYTQIAVDN